jgi:uncharacterized protein (TIGR02145 family)
MLLPRLTNCPECASIPSLLANIDCKLNQLASALYNNTIFALNQPISAVTMLDLLNYKRILTYRVCNPNYAGLYSLNMIASRVIILTGNCKTNCGGASKQAPASTTTSTSSSSTSTTTTICIPRTTTTTSSSSTSTSTTTATPTTTTTSTTSSSTTTTSTTAIPIVDVYGRLYNYFVANGSSGEIANTGWHMPTTTEFNDLETYLGGSPTAGGTLKEVGTTHWLAPNTGATNSSGFTGLPAGYRQFTGVFGAQNQTLYLWSINTLFIGGNYTNGLNLNYNSADASPFSMNPPSDKNKDGVSIRLIKNDSTWTLGDKYTGNDGQLYDTIKIGTQVWMLQNLKETQYRDLSPIPEVLADGAWAALSTGARCYYVI